MPAMAPEHRRRVAGEFLRFLVVGGTNTVVAYGLYLILLHWLRYELAYSLAYLAGISVGYFMNTLFVFRQPLSRRAALRYPLVYLVQYLLSLLVLRVAVNLVGVPAWLALAFAIVATIPVTFVLSRLVIHAR